MGIRAVGNIMQLKEALAQAPALFYPKLGQPFLLHLPTTNIGLSAVLHQDPGMGLQWVAYASNLLNGVEGEFTPCEKEVLALIWVLQHWEYFLQLAPVLLKTSHCPMKQVLTGKINDGHVSSPWLVKWTLALLKKNVNMDKVPVLSPVPYGLMIKGEQHKCPLTEIPPEKPLLFQGGTVLGDIAEKVDVIWFVDGSSYYNEGKPYTRYAAARVSDEIVFK